MLGFGSDNCAGMCPEAVEALRRAAVDGHVSAYSADPFTSDAVSRLEAMFDGVAGVFFVATGTAANTLAIGSLVEPWQRVICNDYSHVATAESTGPEHVARCRLSTIVTEGHKLTPDDLRGFPIGREPLVHRARPGVLTISNPTEFGEVYTPEQVAAICETAHELGYRVHVDGARFSCAVAHLECDPRAITSDAGVDALTFGGTKNGLGCGEAVLFFEQGDGAVARRAAARFPELRKILGHLISKHRFITAPFAAMLTDGIWLKHAGHANAMAARLSGALKACGLPPRFATEANGVFVSLPDDLHEALSTRYTYYEVGDVAWRMGRFMMSFDTSVEEVDALVEDVRAMRS